MVVGPWMVILLILGNAFCHVQAQTMDLRTVQVTPQDVRVQEVLLRPPQDVTLTSENFFTFLTWQPSPDFTNNTQYEVQQRNGPAWIYVKSCQGNQKRQTQRCELLLPDVHRFYAAQVRAYDGARKSEWVVSNYMQPFKDTIVGPLNLSLTATDHKLTVVIALPLTPLENDPSKPFQKSLQNLEYWVALIKEDRELEPRKLRFTEGIINHTYSNLNSNTNYCVKAKAIEQPTKESVQCIRIPGSAVYRRVHSIMPWVIAIGPILISVGVFFLVNHMRPDPQKTIFPECLRFLNLNPNEDPAARSLILSLEEDCVAPLLAEGRPSETSVTLEQKRLQRIPTGGSAQVWSTYCARGFGASNWSSDCLSSGKPENPMGEDYGSDWELMECSEHPSPSSTKLHLHHLGTSYNSWSWECQTGNRSRPLQRSSSSTADVPLSSLKLQTTVDILYNPGMWVIRKDSEVPQRASIQQPVEAEEHPEHHGFPEGSDLQDDSSLLVKDMDRMRFSGYEPRQPILSSEW